MQPLGGIVNQIKTASYHFHQLNLKIFFSKDYSFLERYDKTHTLVKCYLPGHW